jgi:hypothetical protein
VKLNPLTVIDGARALDRLFQLERKHGAILEAQAAEMQAIKDRLTALEQHVRAREDILVAEAKGAAATAGSVVAAQHIADLARRLGGLEERLRFAGGARLPAPD